MIKRIDAAVVPAIMPGPVVSDVVRYILNPAIEKTPSDLATKLDGTGFLLSAYHAGNLLGLLRMHGGALDYRFFHVVCSRVLDHWNLTLRDHSIGLCYYAESLGGPGSDLPLAAALKVFGKSDKAPYRTYTYIHTAYGTQPTANTDTQPTAHTKYFTNRTS